MGSDTGSNWSGKIASKAEASSPKGFWGVGLQRLEEERSGLFSSFLFNLLLKMNFVRACLIKKSWEMFEKQ